MKGYKELLDEIDIHRHLMESAEISFNYWNDKIAAWKPNELKAQQYSDMPHGSKDTPDVQTVMVKAIMFKNRQEEEKEILDKLLIKKKLIDDCIDNVMDITVKVSRLRAVGLTQKEVSELVYISDRHVRRLEKKNKDS